MFTRNRLPGLWILGSVVSPAEFEHLDDYYKALDGAAGGSYSPSGALIIGAAGVSLSGANHHVLGSATLTVDSLGSIVVASGGLIKLDGTSAADIELKVTAGVASINVKAGARIDVQENGDVDNYGAITLKDNGGAAGSGGNLIVEDTGLITVQSGGVVAVAGTLNVNANAHLRAALTVENTAGGGPGSIVFEDDALLQVEGTAAFVAGSDTTFTGDVTVAGATNWVQLTPARDWSAPATHIAVLTYHGSAPAGGSIWPETSDIEDAPCWRTSDETATGHKSILEFTHLPVGAAIDQVTITTEGTKPLSILSTRPTYTIVSWSDSSAAAVTAHSSVETDAHNVATFATTVVQTTIASTGSPVVVAGRRYGLRITHPYEAVNEQGMRIYECTIAGTIDKVTGQ